MGRIAHTGQRISRGDRDGLSVRNKIVVRHKNSQKSNEGIWIEYEWIVIMMFREISDRKMKYAGAVVS